MYTVDSDDSHQTSPMMVAFDFCRGKSAIWDCGLDIDYSTCNLRYEVRRDQPDHVD